MRNKEKMNTVIITLMLFALTVSAVDLPIDIDVIGRDTGSGEAYTANVGVELFTSNAQEITRAINDFNSKKREELISGLFPPAAGEDMRSIHEQVTNAAAGTTIFSQPSDYTGIRMINEDSQIPALLIILLFTASIAGGFVLARTLMGHRKQEKDVH